MIPWENFLRIDLTTNLELPTNECFVESLTECFVESLVESLTESFVEMWLEIFLRESL